MKMKSLFVITAMSMVLAACGQHAKPDWSGDAKNLMKTYLHGEILPYLNGAGNFTVEYDSDNYDVKIQSSEVITSAVLDDYLAVYVEEGWVAADPLYTNTYASIEKKLTLEEGTRWITVDMFLVDLVNEELSTEEGVLLMHTSDPFMYVFPSEHLESIAYYYYGSDVEFSSISAPRYLTGSSGMKLYDVSSDVVSEFIASLDGWDVWAANLVDDFGYRIAISPDKKCSATFKYFPAGNMFDIYIDAPFAKDFDGVKAAMGDLFDLYEEYGANAYEFPLITGADFYKVADGYYNELCVELEMYEYLNGEIAVYGVDADDILAYQSILTGDGWSIVPDEGEGEGEEDEGVAYEVCKEINGHIHYIDASYDDEYELGYIIFTLVGEEA